MDETLDTLSAGGLRILQPRNGYRYSLDALILPFFMAPKEGGSIVELGAGCGVVSMLLARRCPSCRIISVEIQERLHHLHEKNLALNELGGFVQLIHGDIRRIDEFLPPDSAEEVCSNPPFRKVRAGRISPDREKAIARHEVALTLEELVRAAVYLLKKQGRFSLIYLPERLADLVQTLRRNGLEPKRMRMVQSFPKTPPVLLLMEAVKGGRPGMTHEAPLVIYRDEEKNYSDEMEAIYGFGSENVE
ncbi:MAG: methyltransferase [Deltaproteobacteria bacterium]|nr:methyltransferase [Deltaproteobacteria bacterium]